MSETLWMDAVRDEMAGGKDDYLTMLGELMTEYLRPRPELRAPEGKSLKGAMGALRDAARSKAKGGCYAMPPREVFDGMMRYYGRTPESGEFERCFCAVLGQSVPDAPADIAAPAPATAAADIAAPAPATAAADPFDLDALLGE